MINKSYQDVRVGTRVEESRDVVWRPRVTVQMWCGMEGRSTCWRRQLRTIILCSNCKVYHNSLEFSNYEFS